MAIATVGGCVVVALLVCLLDALGANGLWHSSEAGWDIAWTLSSSAALTGCALARRGADDEMRRRWTLWMLAAGAWVVGQLCWNLADVFGQPAPPSGADVFWWLFAVLAMLGMRLPEERRLGMIGDSVPLVGAALAISVALLWSDLMHSTLPVSATVSSLVYRALNVALVIVTLQALIGGQLRQMRSRGVLLVIGGIVLQAAAFEGWAEVQIDRSFLPSQAILDTMWVLGLSAVAIGALLAARRRRGTVVTMSPSYRGAILPGSLFLVNFGVLLREVLARAPTGELLLLVAGLLFSGSSLLLRGLMLERHMRVLLLRERDAHRALARREAELARLNERLVEDSRRDALTGLRNRRALSDDLPGLEALCQTSGVTLALCDVDHFKDYNDRLGHLAGDQALRALATAVRGQLGSEDTAYRFGGEELLLILRTSSASEALRRCERVRAAVEHLACAHPGGIGGVLTVSVGLAGGEGSAEDLLARADAALYEAKRAGRDRVVLASGQEPVPAATPRRRSMQEGAAPRHLRGLLAISRAAACGQGPAPVLEAVAETIRSELSFGVVVCNLFDEDRRALRAVLVSGDQEAIEALAGTSTRWEEWEPMLQPRFERCGAYWLPAGSYAWEGVASWIPHGVPSPAPDAWQPEDALMLPLRGASGRLLGVISVDQPLLGRRPEDDELRVLMAVVDHAALALEQAERESAAAGQQTQELRLAAVMLLAETLDLRDAGTARHSRLVGRFARETAEALRLEPARVERIHAAGVLHDLGKLGIADKILHKPGALNEAEWREMQRHPEIGARILEHSGLADIAAWVRAHHERLDGRGYPVGLTAERIPLEAKILAVADAYEAMVAERPYRIGMPVEEAQAELRRCAGTQFDPVVVEAFLRSSAGIHDDDVSGVLSASASAANPPRGSGAPVVSLASLAAVSGASLAPVADRLSAGRPASTPPAQG